MILLQLSAGQGPIECCQAVGLALKAIEIECRDLAITLDIVEAVKARERQCFKSVLLQLNTTHEATHKDSAKQLAKSWHGAMLWVCQSQHRPKHKRKNWFFSGQMYEVNQTQLDKNVTFKTCRASGPGGQHVNKTDSAVQATHTATGTSVRIESERSQHANKRLARALLFQKLEAAELEGMTQQEKARWQQHWEVQRGNPIKTFTGDKFALKINNTSI